MCQPYRGVQIRPFSWRQAPPVPAGSPLLGNKTATSCVSSNVEESGKRRQAVVAEEHRRARDGLFLSFCTKPERQSQSVKGTQDISFMRVSSHPIPLINVHVLAFEGDTILFEDSPLLEKSPFRLRCDGLVGSHGGTRPGCRAHIYP